MCHPLSLIDPVTILQLEVVFHTPFSSTITILHGLTHNHKLSEFIVQNDHICYFKTNLYFANGIDPLEDFLQHLFICIPLEHRRKRHSLV